MHVEDLLRSMRGGETQTDEAIWAFVRGVTDGSISRPQAAVWLAWAFSRPFEHRETLALTRAMTQSGVVMEWPEGALLVDKHSTGGVGDKVSLVLAPLWAELGLRVPMLSGRGLGHTGGTLDKLEAIPGYRTDLSNEELVQVLDRVGCFICGQTGSLAPADRVLYALRNETQTVPSIPLIVGSILSKKLAEGVQRLVLDVKVGSGAFMKTVQQADALARALVRVATDYGVDCTAHLTAMERPLGEAVGNGCEVDEAVACMKGGGPADLRELTIALANHPRAAEVLDSGAVFERFCRLVEAQGGDASALDRGLSDPGVQRDVVCAAQSGVVQRVDAWEIGVGAYRLGTGRQRAEQPVDPGVGLLVHARPGDSVVAGQPLVTILHRKGRFLDAARSCVVRGVVIGDAAVEVPALIQRTITAADVA